jgi:DinB superfamily
MIRKKGRYWFFLYLWGMLTKSEITVMPPYYRHYLEIIPGENLMDALYAALNGIKSLDLTRLTAIGHQVYAPGKWTVHEILQHIMDTERIFQFRALSFARGDAALLPGMDENAYASSSGASNRDIADIISEMITVRNASISLFKSFDKEMLLRTGTANNTLNSVLAIGFFIAGHQIHHFKVMEERYYSLT